jgi:cytoskeletal protein RodZ
VTNLIEIGQVLKTKREELGLSLPDIEQQTKIRGRYLEAIENGEWSILPGDVYARGFVRSYAEAVGLDGNELLQQAQFAPSPDLHGVGNPSQSNERLEESSREQGKSPILDGAKRMATRPERTQARKRPNGLKQNRRRSHIGVGAGQVAFVVVVLALLGAGWWLLQKPHSAGAASSHPSKGSGSHQTGGRAGNTTGNTTGSGGNATKNSTGSKPSAPTVQVASSSSANGDVTYTVTSTKAQPLSVQLTTSTSACWVQLTEDGKMLNAGGVTLAPNTSKSWHANQSIVIRVGNLNGLSMVVNGKTVTLPQENHPINVTIVNKGQ